MTAADLSAEAIVERELAREVEQAAATLMARSERLRTRAFRARAGSNEEQTCRRRAALLHAYAVFASADRERAEEIAASAGLGWRQVAEAVAVAARKTGKRP